MFIVTINYHINYHKIIFLVIFYQSNISTMYKEHRERIRKNNKSYMIILR